MKIHKFGTVILTEGPVKVDGWNVEREPEDPIDATTEQLLLGFAITWAKERLTAATNDAILDVFRAAAKQKKSEAMPGEQMVDIAAYAAAHKPS